MSETQSVIETASAVTASAAKTSFWGGVGTLLGKATGIDPVTAIGLIVGIGGLLVSVVGLFISWHYKRKDDKRKEREDQRKQELHVLQLQQFNGECNVKD